MASAPKIMIHLLALLVTTTTVRGHASVAVIMYDTRRPYLEDDWAMHNQYWTAGAYLNGLWACKAGYDFIYYLEVNSKFTVDKTMTMNEGFGGTSKTQVACHLDGTVGRSPPWCKLAAVADALKLGYERVIFIDSDAFLKTTGWGVKRDVNGLIAKFGGKDPRNHVDECDLWMPPDNNVRFQFNSGLQIWTKSPDVWDLLRRWWQTDVVPTHNAYEQDGLRVLAEFDPSVAKRYCILYGLDFLKDWGKAPAVHVNSNRHDLRAEVFSKYLDEAKAVHGHDDCDHRYPIIREFNATQFAQAHLDTNALLDLSRLWSRSSPPSNTTTTTMT